MPLPMQEQKSKPRAPRPQDLELESIRIQPAENGYVLDIQKRVKRDRRAMVDGWPEAEHLVFTDAREMLKAIGSRLGIKVKPSE